MSMLLAAPPPAVEIDSRVENNLLRVLRPRDYALLRPHLQMVEAQTGDVLYSPGDVVVTTWFPCGPSLASFLVTSEDGRDVETVMVGREGSIGGIVSRGVLPAYTRMVVQVGGPFARLRVEDLARAQEASPALRHVFQRYADCLLAQVFQSTACNAIHSIEQRAAKWIVSAMERTGDHVVPLTQERLAAMLGVGRSYVSLTIRTLKNAGAVETRRGALVVRDRDRLTERACGCNEAVKAHFEQVLRGVYPEEDDEAG
jgi:hypothetical protein